MQTRFLSSFRPKISSPACFRVEASKKQTAKIPVKYYFFPPVLWLWRNVDGRKTGKKVGICRNQLCKPKCIRFAHSPCGKALWKKLWRMWKSMSFQQLFSLFCHCVQAADRCIPACIRPVFLPPEADYVSAFNPAFSCQFCRKS